MTSTNRPRHRRRARRALCVRALLVVLIVAGTEVHLQPARWWRSPPVLSALRLTSEQSAAIERLYQDSQPARRETSEELFALTNQINARVGAGNYDDELLHLTENLARCRRAQRELRQRMQELAARTLSPQQRATLNSLVTEPRVMK